MSKSGPRPHTWIIQGEPDHTQYVAWSKSKAQAEFRGEQWELTFKEYQEVWQGLWHQRGRHRDSVCMTRQDSEGAWSKDNVICVSRLEHLRRKNLEKSRRTHELRLQSKS